MLASSPCATGSTGRVSPPMLRPDTWSIVWLQVYAARKFRPRVGRRRALACSASYQDSPTENVGRSSE